MQKLLKYTISFLLIFTLSLSLTVLAQENQCTIKIPTITANQGDVVYVPITIQNNPGIGAVTGTVTYDADTLEYNKFTKGGVFKDSFMVKDHPSKNMFKFVVLESVKDTTNDGDIITLQFTVKQDAKAGLHKITMKTTKGDFANRKNETIEPIIIAGGVKVNLNANSDNCPHAEYSDWKVVVNATCTENGVEQKECLLCAKKETRKTDKKPHDYETEWTIDSPATKTKDGVMSRHCKHCTAKTQVLTFPFTDTTEENFENDIGAEIPPGDFTDDLINDQYPNESSNPSSSKVPTTSSAFSSKTSGISTGTSSKDSNTISSKAPNATATVSSEFSNTTVSTSSKHTNSKSSSSEISNSLSSKDSNATASSLPENTNTSEIHSSNTNDQSVLTNALLTSSDKEESKSNNQEQINSNPENTSSIGNTTDKTNSNYKIIAAIGIGLMVCLLGFIIFVATRKTK